MRFLNCSILLAVFVGLSALSAHAGDVVDKIVAKVNGHPVLKSDWEDELAFEAFVNGRELDTLTAVERKAALERLIDQELLREQVRPSVPAPKDVVASKIGELRKLHPNSKGEEGWRATLSRYGMTQTALEKRLGDDIQLMRLVEEHLRPSIHIDPSAVETYYQQKLLPEMQKKGGGEVALAEVSGRIKTLLGEQKLNELIAGWLQSLRSESRISIPAAAGDNGTASGLPGGGEQNR
jgi:SurA-like protein